MSEKDRRLLKTVDTTTSSDTDVLCIRYSTFVSGAQASDHIFDWSLESLTRTFAYEKMYDVT